MVMIGLRLGEYREGRTSYGTFRVLFISFWVPYNKPFPTPGCTYRNGARAVAHQQAVESPVLIAYAIFHSLSGNYNRMYTLTGSPCESYCVRSHREASFSGLWSPSQWH